MSQRAIVYYRPGCPFAIRLRVALTLRRIPFVSVRFRDDEAAAAKVRDINDGNEISPTVRIGGTYLTNPPARAVAARMRPPGRVGPSVGPKICRFP
jgi:glutaredoxin